jgi:Secretion system C-terminal sorting domain
MKKCYVFLCLFMAFSSFLTAQVFDSLQVNLQTSSSFTTYDLAKSRVSPPPILLFDGANLGTFNPSVGQTLKISGRKVIFKNSTPCQVASMTFSYELYKDISSPVLISSGYGINLPLDLNFPPISVWKILGGVSDINLVTASTTNGDYILKLKYDYVFAFGPVCMMGGNGSSGWISATFGVLNTPLAVEMSTLSARKESNKAIAILWKTAKEQSNNGFQIERSSDGENFTAIGRIKGEINSTVEKAYNFSDASPLQGINYYRIKSLALDGKETISKVVSVNFSDKVKTALQVFPNPAYSALQVEVMSDEESTKTVQVFDLAGRVILTQNAALTKGLNSLSLDVNTVLAGTYLVKVGSEVSRFVKM